MKNTATAALTAQTEETSAAALTSQMEGTFAAALRSQIVAQEIRIAGLEAGARDSNAAYCALVARLGEIELRLVNGF